ncbi:hypothetical protein CEXT_430691 [Caerostris extrusa]|uniref:Uncharacterized protein n=1 Tax=Caerostris extrusa TaxID=172846 RepID=A0AAV4XH69_CAEEX|nr:hypothetical protein CEXT_430691 [Caerostris extrusa]
MSGDLDAEKRAVYTSEVYTKNKGSFQAVKERDIYDQPLTSSTEESIISDISDDGFSSSDDAKTGVISSAISTVVWLFRNFCPFFEW